MTRPIPTLSRILRENAYFFYLFLLFLLVAGIVLLLIETGDEIFFFSGRRTFWADVFFVYFTNMGEWYPYVLAIALLPFLRLRYAFTVPLLGGTVTLITYTFKAFFSHPRPFVYLRDLNLLERLIPVEGVHLNEGMNSFPSGHTLSAFALYCFLALCTPSKRWGDVLFFLLALLVGLSRIYLVQHFLKDVYLGAILGVLIGLFWYMLQYRIWPEPHPHLDRSLLQPRREAVESVEQVE